MLLSQHHLLFTQRSLEEQLQQPFDDANCWLGSVEEAIETRIHHVDILRSEAAEFFPTKSQKMPSSPSETISMGSTASYSSGYSSQTLDNSKSIDTVHYFQSPTSLPSKNPCASSSATYTSPQSPSLTLTSSQSASQQ
jgi:hypothetical protein